MGKRREGDALSQAGKENGVEVVIARAAEQEARWRDTNHRQKEIIDRQQAQIRWLLERADAETYRFFTETNGKCATEGATTEEDK